MRHQFLSAALIAGSFAGGQSPAGAQLSDRVVPIPEITEEAAARIDLQDGTVDEWWDILGEPALTITDFEIVTRDLSAYDPRDGSNTKRTVYAAAPHDSEIWRSAESFVDAVLLGADGTGGGGTAVKPDSWARIKASLAE